MHHIWESDCPKPRNTHKELQLEPLVQVCPAAKAAEFFCVRVGSGRARLPFSYRTKCVQWMGTTDDSGRGRWLREIIDRLDWTPDVFFACGNEATLRNRPGRDEECAVVMLAEKITVITEEEVQTTRNKRGANVNTFGIPVGVPSEFQAIRNPIGWSILASLPFLTGITSAKHSMWINYLYYNQQRLVNSTAKSLLAIEQKLTDVTRTVLENRQALDIVLAERGGLCAFINADEGCCTNVKRLSDMSNISLAIQVIKDLQHEFSDLNNMLSRGWFDQWMNKTFGQFSGMVTSVLLPIASVIILMLLFCMCVPCIIGCIQQQMARILLVHSPDFYPVPNWDGSQDLPDNEEKIGLYALSADLDI